MSRNSNEAVIKSAQYVYLITKKVLLLHGMKLFFPLSSQINVYLVVIVDCVETRVYVRKCACLSVQIAYNETYSTLLQSVFLCTLQNVYMYRWVEIIFNSETFFFDDLE